MKRSPNAVSGKALKAFRRRKVVNLGEVPEFDADGLWHWRGVFFSRYGNLKQTVVELIRRSSAGLDAGEMGSLLGLGPRSFLSSFADHPQSRTSRYTWTWRRSSRTGRFGRRFQKSKKE